MLSTLLVLHLVAALVAPPAARRSKRLGLAVAAIPPVGVLAWLIGNAALLTTSGAVEEHLAWVPQLDLAVVLRVDALSALMLLLVTAIGVLVIVYARGYFGEADEAGPFAGAMVGFAGAMTGLVIADHLLLLYVFWELTSVASYLLIAGDGTDDEARSSAQHAMLVTVGGGLAMLAGFVLLGQAAGTYRITELGGLGSSTAVTAGALLVLVGAFTKSAQVPFHGWLTGAMVAPTPVSAYLHSATMVTAGVYLVTRLSPVLAGAVGVWSPVTVTVGIATFLLAAWWAMFQRDLKLLLAYGTISQLGLMMALVGSGELPLIHAGIAVLFAHALYKSGLFLVVGGIDHATGTRDIRRLRGVGRVMPVTAGLAAVVAASMMAIPPLFGYVVKEAALDELLHLGGGWLAVALLVALGGALTVTYGLRFLVGAFTDRPAGDAGPDAGPATPEHEHGVVWNGPILLLAIGSIAAGILAARTDTIVGAATAATAGTSEGSLALWHGFGWAVVLSAIALGVGVALQLAHAGVTKLRARLPTFPPAEWVFQRIVAGLMRVSGAVTAVVQNGSLPVYLAVIVSTAVIASAAGLLTGPVLTSDLSGLAPPLQVAVALVLVAAVVGITVTHRRFVALLFLGAVGYGMAVLFWLQGAPDLALTQVTIETVALMIFVLVIRHLPESFVPPRWAFGRLPRFAISGMVGVFVAGMAVLVTAVDHPPSIAWEYLARAVPEADGHNVVNVILVDFRALDTVGEITVLVIAALGISELVGRGTLEEDRPRIGPLFTPAHVSPIAVTAIRAVYPAVLLASAYFLFAGHNLPGGGFVGGLVAGAGLLLRYVSDSTQGVRDALPVTPATLLATGLLLALGTGIIGGVLGDSFLQHGAGTVALPLFGDVKASSTLVFDLGVYLIVIGFVANALVAFGAEETSS